VRLNAECWSQAPVKPLDSISGPRLGLRKRRAKKLRKKVLAHPPFFWYILAHLLYARPAKEMFSWTG